MAKHIFRRLLPNHQAVREHKSLRFLAPLLHEPNLWHINRHTVAGGFAVGLFMAFLPIPFQMAAAAVVAIGLRVNLPISVALVWISNPLTMPPIFFFAYEIGSWLLGVSSRHTPTFTLTLSWFGNEFLSIWKPLLLGCLLLSLSSSIRTPCHTTCNATVSPKRTRRMHRGGAKRGAGRPARSLLVPQHEDRGAADRLLSPPRRGQTGEGEAPRASGAKRRARPSEASGEPSSEARETPCPFRMLGLLDGVGRQSNQEAERPHLGSHDHALPGRTRLVFHDDLQGLVQVSRRVTAPVLRPDLPPAWLGFLVASLR